MRRLLSLGCAVLAAAHAATFLGATPLDDEYILYRYAERWLDGLGLTFDDGARVEGYTQPLWLLLLAATRALGIGFEHATATLGLACAAGAAYATAEAWRARFGAAPGVSGIPWPAALLALSPAFAFHAVAGLGTPLLAACLAAWCACYVRDEERGRAGFGAAIWLGLAGLARPEALVLILPYLAVEAQRGRLRRAWPCVVPLAAWTLFRRAYYGAWLPVTYGVKKLPPEVDLVYGLRYLWRSTLETGFLFWLALAAAWAWRRPVTLGRALWVATAGSLLHALYVLWVGGDYMTLGRFVAPVLPLVLCAGCAALRGLLLRRRGALAATLVAAAIALSWAQIGPRRLVFELHEVNEERWIAVGRELARRAAPGTKVATSAVGAIGFHSRLPIVDTLGRTNATIQHVEPDLAVDLKSHHRSDPAWTLAQEPDVVLINGGRDIEVEGRLVPFLWDAGLVQAAAAAGYRVMAMPVEGSYPLTFLLRPGAREPDGAVRLDG